MESECVSSVGCTIIINGDYIEVGNSPSRMCVLWTFEPKLDNDDTPLCRPNSAPKETGDRWSVQFNPKRGALHFRFPFDDTLYFKDDKTTEISF